MAQLIIDVFFSSVFLLLLVLLTKIRVKAFENNKDSYRYTYFGILVLGAVSLLQLVGHQNLLSKIPFLSEPVYIELILGIGIVSGVTMMIAGASIWLPGKKKKSEEMRASNGSTHSFKIEKVILHSQNVKSVLKRIPEIISNEFNFDSYIIFSRQNHLKKYVNTDYKGLEDNESVLLKNYDFSAGDAKKQAAELMTRVPSDYCLQIMVNNTAQILMFFRKENGEIVTDSDRKSLDAINKALSYRLKSEFISNKEEFYANCWKYSGYIKNILAAKNSISQNLTLFHRLFNQAIGSEYFSLVILGKNQTNPKVYTVGINGNILLDGGNPSIMKNWHFRKTLTDKKPVLINNINETDSQVADSMFIGCGQCSLIAQPIIIDDQVAAILTLGHSAAAHFDRKDLLLVETMAYSMTSAIESELNQYAIYERDRCLAAINGFESAVRKVTDIDSLLKAAADSLLNNLSTTMVRISLLDNFRTKLKTAAIKTVRPMADINTDDAILSKELTYWHRIVADEGRLLLINQNDTESRMNKSEVNSIVFPGVQSALIVPIVVNGRTFGMITLGEMRAWDRTSYNSTVISFCKMIAAKIADTIKLQLLSRMITSSKDLKDRLNVANHDKNLLRRLKTPMTNLQGSLEILKIKGPHLDVDANRILSRMEESSNDIVNLLNDY